MKIVLLKNERLLESASKDLDLPIFPDFDGLPFSENSPSVKAERVKALISILRGKVEGFVTTITAISRLLPSPEKLLKVMYDLKVGEKFPLNAEKLSMMGYSRVDYVSSVGEFSVRGEIVDVFTPSEKYPVRVELFDEDVEDIRLFDPFTQKSIDKKSSVEVLPASENLSGNPELDTLPHLRGDTSTIFDYLKDFEVFAQDLEEILKEHEKKLREIKEVAKDRWDIYKRSMMPVEEIVKLLGDVKRVDLKAKIVEKFTERVESMPILDIDDLQVGDLVVHKSYGVGRFEGIKRLKSALGEKDFVRLKYSDAVLYVPVDRLSKIHKYIGPDSREIDSMRSSRWRKRVKRIRKDIERRVKELVKLYAKRSTVRGISLLGDPELEERFAQTFPHIETSDQLRAIREVLEDLASDKPMDRLISGDSGYGKTEVALRAAFRTVVSGKQVALLAPTVVLANQHYRVFKDRLEDFGVVVEILDSTKKGKKREKVLNDIARGLVDVVIGTHSLLSKDVKFADLGLVIIDEEQKFGVEQKERLKKLRLSVNVLSMSATPIPRTLHMALSGMKDISVIRTPPLGRKSVVVNVAPYSDSIVKAAVLRELARGGQVIYVHNRVEEISKVHERIKRILPDVSTVVAHGRMNKRKLERAIDAFLTGDVDLLLCTAIIESGIDIGTANTIIVDDAHRYGLAQLYQLRGRVGRRYTKGYAYFLYPKGASKDALKRLEIIKSVSGAGSGMEIAIKDMEMRGYGDVLGLEQSGHIESIGYKYYVEMLREAVGELKGEKSEEIDVEIIGYPGDVHIPENYVRNPLERLRIYRRLALARSLDDVKELASELRDRFGRLPQPAMNLLELSRFRIRLSRIGVEKVEIGKGSITLKLRNPEPGFFSDIPHAFVSEDTVVVMKDLSEFSRWLSDRVDSHAEV